MEEKVLAVLSKLGFVYNHVEGVGYEFEFERNNYLYLPNSNDESFLNICIPFAGDIEKNESNEASFYKFVTYLNHQMKYVKAYNMQDNLWLFYEREILESDNLEEVVRRMIYSLDAGLFLVKRSKEEMEVDDGDDGDDDSFEELADADDENNENND